MTFIFAGMAMIAFLILVIMYFNYKQVLTNSRLKERRPRLRIAASWILLFLMVGGISGAIYSGTHQKQHTVKKVDAKQSISSNSKLKKQATIKIEFSPKAPKTGEKVTFKVSAKTKVEIYNPSTKKVLQTFKAGKNSQAKQFEYTFNEAGTFDLVLSRGSTRKTLSIKVTVKKGNGSSVKATQPAVSNANQVISSSSSSTSSYQVPKNNANQNSTLSSSTKPKNSDSEDSGSVTSSGSSASRSESVISDSSDSASTNS